MYGLFIGIHCADGTIPKYKSKNPYLWEFSDKHIEAAIFVKKLFEKEFNRKPYIKKRKNHFVVYIKSKDIWLFFTDRLGFPIGKKSEIIDKPHSIKKYDWKDFVNGVIGSDGTFFKDKNGAPRIRLRIRSKKLRNSVSSILEYYRIIHTIGKSFESSKPPNTDKIYERDYYRLDIYGKNVKRYLKIFGVWHPIQRRKIENIIFEFERVRETGAPC
ncbi:MAG: LAGLIDADG family homing endonuclease [Candidatus Aenigmarchaeota archaeon]|nr:LAGLIDADG family homing endonuclease [Candidatus Aenigmarchaeota archaeon]